MTYSPFTYKSIIPAVTDGYDLGSPSIRWQDGYFDGYVYLNYLKFNDGTIQGSASSGSGGSLSGSGTAGQVTYWSGASSLTGNNNLFWDNTNARLGIGTANPTVKTHIRVGGSNTLLEALRLTNADSTDTGGSAVGLGLGVESGTHIKGMIAYERLASFGRGSFHFLQNSAADATDATLANAAVSITNAGNVGIGSSAPTHKLQIPAGSLGSGINVINASATMSSSDANQKGMVFSFTTAGSGGSAIQIGQELSLNAGYTGGRQTYGISVGNSVAGTGTGTWAPSNNEGNIAVSGNSLGATSGHRTGVFGTVSDSTSQNAALFGLATTSATGANIGAVGTARNGSGTQIGGYFGLNNSTPTFTSAALIADNSNQTSPIFLGRDNGTIVFTVIDGGNVGIGTTNPQTKLESYSNVAAVFDGLIVNNPNAAGFSAAAFYEGSTARARFQFNNGSPNFFVHTLSTHPLYLGTNNTIRLAIDGITGNVALGDTPVTNKFWVTADGSAGTPAITIGTSIDTDTGFYHPAANTLSMSTNAAERFSASSSEFVHNDPGNNYDFRVEGDNDTSLLFIDASADAIGVGHTAPDLKLVVASSSNVAGAGNGIKVQWADTTAANRPIVGFYRSRGTIASPGNIATNDVLGSFSFLGYPAGSFTSYATARTVYNGSGGLLEIYTSPSAGGDSEVLRLSIDHAGVVSVTTDGSASVPSLTFGTTADPNTGIFHPTADTLAITTGGTEALRVDSSQQLGIGVSPSEKLSLKDHTAFAGSETQTTTGAVQTTDATQTSVKVFTLADTTLYWFEVLIIGRETGGTDRAKYHKEVLVYREGGGATLQGAVQDVTADIETNGAWDATFTVSSNDIRVSVTGAAATTINWTCTVRYQAVSGNA